MSDLGSFFAGYDDSMERKEPGYKARKAAEQAERNAGAAEYRRSIISAYGSEQQALADCKPGRALAEATVHLTRKVMHKYVNGTFPCDSLDGWKGSMSFEKMPTSVIVAVSSAYALPQTVAEARVELEHWELRTKEIEAVLVDHGDEVLPLPCQARRDIVSDLYVKGLQVRTIDDLHERLKLAARRGEHGDAADIIAALLPEFERLMAQPRVLAQADRHPEGGDGLPASASEAR